MSFCIKYHLEIFGDLHVGSGTGLQGVIDEYIVRDHDGFPQVPSSEIRGLVRDSFIKLLMYQDIWDNEICSGQKKWHEMQQLMRGVELDDFCGLNGDEKLCILCALFGSPASMGSLWFSPAEYPSEYRKKVNDIEKKVVAGLKDWDTTVNTQTSIDRNTKRAKEDHLFNLESVRPSWKLRGKIDSIPTPQDQPEPRLEQQKLLGWITASLLFTRRLGGRKRRGWGRCRFHLRDSPDALEALTSVLGGDCP